MRNKLKSFAVCHTGLILGEVFKAIDIHDLIQNKLPKRVLERWEIISFVDSENRNISVTREYIDEDGMTIDEVIQDWIDNGHTEEPILCLNPNNSTLTKGIAVRLTEFGYEFEK
jgi:hypothetical protein